jgi:hypothetical protein
MRINIGQTRDLFCTQAINNSLRRNISREEQKAGVRTDQTILSPQGKSSGLLASLMNQKELIQMNKESLIKRELGEDGIKTGNFSKQLEEYEKQLEELDEQIAREMAKQAQGEKEEGTIYKDPRDADSEKTPEEHIMELSTEDSAAMEKAQTLEDARETREREKSTAKTQAGESQYGSPSQWGSPSAERRLKEVADKERLASQIAPILEDDKEKFMKGRIF